MPGLLYAMPQENTMIAITVYMLASLAPDIDNEKSVISQLLHCFLPVVHRGITHSVWPLAGIGILGLTLSDGYVWYAAAGYLVHLLVDSMSQAGICWFYPFQAHKVTAWGCVVVDHSIYLYSTGNGEWVAARRIGMTFIVVSVLIIVAVR